MINFPANSPTPSVCEPSSSCFYSKTVAPRRNFLASFFDHTSRRRQSNHFNAVLARRVCSISRRGQTLRSAQRSICRRNKTVRELYKRFVSESGISRSFLRYVLFSGIVVNILISPLAAVGEFSSTRKSTRGVRGAEMEFLWRVIYM